MTKRYAEEEYAKLIQLLTYDCCIVRTGAHLYKGKLVPGITYMEGMDQDKDTYKVNVICWVPDKQLTTKQLIKLLTVWKECVIKEKSSN